MRVVLKKLSILNFVFVQTPAISAKSNSFELARFK